MSVSPMKAISIIGLKNDLDKVIKGCGSSSVFHPDEVPNFYSDTRKFTYLSQQNPYAEQLSELDNTLAMAEIEPSLVDNIHVDKFNASDNQIKDFVDFFSKKLGGLVSKVAIIKKQIDDCNTQIAQASHFVGFELPMDRIADCMFIKPTFGRLPIESYQKLSSYENNPYIMFFPCTNDDDYYWGVYVAPIDELDEVDRIFSGLFFEKIDISGMHSSPEDFIGSLKNKLNSLKSTLKETNDEINVFMKAYEEECMLYYTKLTELYTYYNIKSHIMTYNRSFVLVGWVPAEDAQKLTDSLDKIKSVECTLSDATNELGLSPPIKLKNNIFTRPYEYYLKMFGLPKYNEIDPTGIMAVTYTLLFGIMFGDLGHGAVLIIAGILMWNFKKMELGKILIPCGISSSIFGVLFGSVFGFEHALDGFYSSAFGLHEKPIDVMAPETINAIILAAVGIGVILVILAIALNIYTSLRQRNYESALFGSSGLAGLIFYSALAVGLICQMLLGIEIMSLPYILLLIVLPLIVIFLREPLGNLAHKKKQWQPESWGEYCMQNIFELIEILLSYVTNTMSFLRVGAFVLVHAGMMLVVFTLAEMSSGIGYVAILILGNALVIVLEALIVSIQVLRLEFYELFSRFYSGTGRPFEPVIVERLKNR